MPAAAAAGLRPEDGQGTAGRLPLPPAPAAGHGSGLVHTSLIQRRVPQDVLGRIFSVLLTSASLAMTLSVFALAPLLDRLPLPMGFALNAAVLLAAVVWTLVVLSEQPV
ncbi:hypothetical protein [uncultured Deinococcus sp.]|uniref:hypothetical protein n=1 Tax=uncultured Deinococcus sp. TaxID=158789 RepID=UPI0025EB4EF5|nr:hypothetical protein [uncultured Deinococcus sp.]